MNNQMKIFTHDRKKVPAFNTPQQKQNPNTVFEEGI